MLRSALSDDDRDVDLGVHNVSKTAMIAAMIAIAAAGLPSFAMVGCFLRLTSD